MKLISLKQSKKERKELEEVPGPADNQYPWGTRLNFEKDTIDKIKSLQTIDAGTEVKIMAIGIITEVRSTDYSKRPKHQNVEIQIQQIEIKDNTDAEASFNEK